jgi:exonuclease VII small subunit
MSLEQLQQMVDWLEHQIEYLDGSINEAQQSNNYGRKLQHEGMRDAYSKCLSQLNKSLKKKAASKTVQTNI